MNIEELKQELYRLTCHYQKKMADKSRKSYDYNDPDKARYEYEIKELEQRISKLS